MDGQPVLGADLNRSESRWPASVPKTAQVKTGNVQNKQMLSALPPLATGERTFRIGSFVPNPEVGCAYSITRPHGREGMPESRYRSISLS